MKTHILLTGGAGYIGSHMALWLYEKGFVPVVLDDLSTGFEHAVQWGPFIKADIVDTSTVKKIIEQYAIKTVIHFAAVSLVAESLKDPMKYYENNTLKSIVFARACQQMGISAFVYSSSCAVYGHPQSVLLTERHPISPIHPYGHSKAMSEQILLDIAQQGGMKVAVLRYFNAAGADFEARIGESHLPETHLIPLALRAAFLGTPFQVFGQDYPTKDGTCMRDFVHVVDLAHAHDLALQLLLASDQRHWVFNIGSGRAYSVLEMVQSIEKVTEKKITLQWCDRRPGDPSVLVSDPTFSKKALGFQTQHSDLEKIVYSAWKWVLCQSKKKS